MRKKLSEQYHEERESICKRIIEILELDHKQCFFLKDLDEDEEKQRKLLELKPEIKKVFTVSNISTFKPGFECKKPYLNMVRSILKQQGYTVKRRITNIVVETGIYKPMIKYCICR